MTILNIRNKIAAQLQLIDTNLKIYPYIPSTPQENTFIYLHYDLVDHQVSYSKTLSKMNFNITICTLQMGTIEQAQAELDNYVDSTGDRSIRAKIEAMTPSQFLPDASHFHLTEARDFARYSFNGNPYYGCKMTLEVYTV